MRQIKCMQQFCTISITFSGTVSVIGVSIKPGRTALHLTPNLHHRENKNSQVLLEIITLMNNCNDNEAMILLYIGLMHCCSKLTIILKKKINGKEKKRKIVH